MRASKVTKDEATVRLKKEADLTDLRGYCLLCSRYYFAKNGLQTEAVQFHQYRYGVCHERNYICARIFASPAWAETRRVNEASTAPEAKSA